MADPYTYTGEEEECGWSDGMAVDDELERKPPADDDADDGHLGDTATDDDEGQDTLDLHDMTLLTQQQQDPSDRGDAYSTDDGYHQQQHLLTQEGVDADDGGYHDDDLGSVLDGYILMNNGDDDGVGISSSDGEGDSGDDTSRSGSSSSGDGSDDDDDDDDDSSSDDSDESVTQLEKDLRAVDATASPAGGTPRIIRNRRRAIARNKERLRLLMEGVERPGAPVAGPDGGDTTAENGNAIVDNAKQRGKKKKRSGRTGRKSKSPGKGCSGKTGKRRGMLFPTRYNAVEPSSVLAAGSTSTTKAAAASPIGLSQSSECSASTPATQQQQTYKSIAEEVGNRFPHREAQIRLLCSVFERTMQQTGGAIGVDGTTSSSSSRRPTASDDISTSSDGTFVPSPVFVTGPSGVGKTSVIRDILQCLKRRHADTSSSSILSPSLQKQQKQKPSIAKAGGVGMGYIDCSSMEGSTAGAFLEEAYKQILRSFFSSSSRKPSRRSRKRKRHGALSPKRQMNDGTNANVTNGGGAPAPGANSKEVRSTNQSAGRNGGQNGTSALQNQDETKPPAIDNGNEKLTSISPAKAPASRHTPLDDEEIDPMIGHDDEEEGFGDIEDQIEQQKKEHLRTKIAAQQSGGLVAGGAGGERSEDSTLSARRHHAITTPADFGRALLPLCGGPDDLVSKSRYCGCAFLVVDHADRLLSMTAKQNSPYNAISKDERNNLLSQLLLLPRVMGLNLTIVVLTTNSLLEFGRTNNVHMQPSSSLGTIQDAIHPMRVRFHAYRGKLIYRSILLQPSIKDVVIGCSRRNSRETRNMCPGSQRIINIARDRLYNAMIKTILQSLEGMTRDIREIQRFARIFWPIYISPLTTGHAQDPNGVIKQKFCLVLASSGNTQAQKGQEDDPSPGLCRQETCGFCRAVVSLKVPPSGRIDSILEMLDIKGRKPMREIISKCLFAPVQKLDTTAYPETNQDATFLRTVRDLQGSSLAQLSYMAKFLLLSAYLCQKNRQEQDLALFTHHNKGRRRKTSSEGNNADGEGALFASSAIAQQQLRSFRLVGFPLERMISVFSSILSKYGSESEFLRGKIQQDGYLNVTEVGSTQLFACLAELRDFGLLCDMNGGLSANVAAGTGHIDMAAKKYTCNLADADATALANELEIPLQKYLLQEN